MKDLLGDTPRIRPTYQEICTTFTCCSTVVPLTSRSEALVSRHDALLRQLHRPLRPCLRLLRALALQVALAPDLVELQTRV